MKPTYVRNPKTPEISEKMQTMMKAAADADERHRHRHPTRGKLCCPTRGKLHHPTRCKLRYGATSYFPKEVSRVEDRGKHQHCVPYKTRKEVRHILYFPRDIMFKILLLVPVTVLHQVVRYVCKQWNDIVNDPCFIKSHCQSPSAGRLMQNPVMLHHVYYIEGDNSTEIAFPYPARIYGSFNGLVLFHDLTNLKILSVINPVTKAKISLPPVHGLEYVVSSIGFAITSYGHYKVVVSVPHEDESEKNHVMVFTIGVDKAWRFIDLQGNLEMESMPRSLPLFIDGMLYWCFFNYPCFAMDVDTETIYHFSTPDDSVLSIKTNFLSLVGGLGFIKEDKGKWRLWKLIDVKSGVWNELAGINLSAVFSTVSRKLFPRDCRSSLPFMLIEDMLWLYFVVDGDFVVIHFNLANESFVFFSITSVLDFTSLPHHVHTLLSPKKCYLRLI